MFTQFFYALKRRKVPVSLTEWMTLMEALSKGYISNLDEFYYLARAILVKSETYFDAYDVAFQEYFKGVETPLEITEQILEWLKDPINRELLTAKEKQLFDRMSLDELIKEFEKRLQEQKEQHDGGNYWIGRGGTSPFGHSGNHPGGIRIGGASGGRSAVKVAEQRLFRNYRSDITLDVRQIKLALKRLRQLNKIGPEDELDLKETIDTTCKNGGDIELVWTRSRKNATKLLLLMDVGGSMDPYVSLCSRLFSAAHSMSHFKDFKYYYFHNCVYDDVYVDMERRQSVNTEHLLRTFESDYRVVIMGDASMAPEELMERWGAIYYYQRNDTPGMVWLKRIAEHFPHHVWLNPEEPRYWAQTTTLMIGKLFPMYPLTLDGLNQAVKKLIAKR